jgi:hypothetical protein
MRLRRTTRGLKPAADKETFDDLLSQLHHFLEFSVA